MRWILWPLALALPLAGCGGNGDVPGAGSANETAPPAAPADTAPGEAGAPGRVVVTLEEQEGSGVSGTAELTPESGDTEIVVELDDDEPRWTAYLQEGDCTAVSADAAEVLPLFLEGRSETVVDADLAELVDGSFVIAIHDEEGDLERPAACGEIGATEP